MVLISALVMLILLTGSLVYFKRMEAVFTDVIYYKNFAKKYFDPGFSYRQYIKSFKYWV